MSARAAWRLEWLGFEQVYYYTAGKADWAANGLPTEGELASQPRIGDLAHADVATCAPSDTAAQALEQMRNGKSDLCVVVNAQRIVPGALRGKALQAAADTCVEDVMDAGP